MSLAVNIYRHDLTKQHNGEEPTITLTDAEEHRIKFNTSTCGINKTFGKFTTEGNCSFGGEPQNPAQNRPSCRESLPLTWGTPRVPA